MLGADYVWRRNLRCVLNRGESATPHPGGIHNGNTLELIDFSSRIDMHFPVVTNRNRKLGYRFLAAEARWILNGDDRVATIEPYSPIIAKFSDDGERFFGAYGPRIADQMRYIVATLLADPHSRQAVATIWRPSPPKSKDIPCTVSVQFLIRDDQLFCIDTMRSSDLWLGWPYDVFNFSMLSASLVLVLREHGMKDLDLGWLTVNAGSQHLYTRDIEQARKCVAESQEIEYAPLDLEVLGSVGVVPFLTLLADHPHGDLPWLKEIVG
jgi:thymidylate synthase